MNRLLLCATVAVALFAAHAARAQVYAPDVTKVFTAVDRVYLEFGRSLVVTGVLQGNAAASTETFTFPGGVSDSSNQYYLFALQDCVRLGTVAMAKPGAYHFEVGLAINGWGGSTWYDLSGCALSRAVP